LGSEGLGMSHLTYAEAKLVPERGNGQMRLVRNHGVS
jgi:hypothetical protein